MKVTRIEREYSHSLFMLKIHGNKSMESKVINIYTYIKIELVLTVDNSVVKKKY